MNEDSTIALLVVGIVMLVTATCICRSYFAARRYDEEDEDDYEISA
jgi:hypothetical protein